MDLVQRLEAFATFCSGGRSTDNKPFVKSTAGFALPNSADPAADRSSAKILHCSAADVALHPKWGKMESHNRELMGGKTTLRLYCRNLGFSSEEAKALLADGRACLQKFFKHSSIGTSMFVFNPKLPAHSAAPSSPTKQAPGFGRPSVRRERQWASSEMDP